MGILANNPFVALGNPGTGYQIEQSLRFDGGAQLTRTPSSASNRKTWTISCWVKYVIPSGEGVLWMAGPGAYEKAAFKSGTPHDLNWAAFTNPTTHYRLQTNQVFRDPSAWFHCVFVSDTDNGTAADRKRLYINGERVTSWATETNPSPGYEGQWNSTQTHRIGADTNPFYFNGYVAEFHSVDGTALDPTDFGEYDDNGVWRPIAYTGSHGTNGFYLTFNPGATNGIGHDHSGNGNNFSPTGFTTSGTGTDVMSDTPTTNYATLNPLWARNTYGLSTLSNGNLEFSASGLTTSWGGRGSTFEIKSGKWYCEWAVGGSSPTSAIIAVMNTGFYGLEHFMVQNPQTQTGFWGPQQSDPSRDLRINGSLVTTSSPYYDSLNGAITGVAIDADAGTATWYRNGTAISGLTDIDITAGDGDAWVVMGLTSDSAATTFIANFGQRAFEQTPPTSYSAWNTRNLSAPDIKDGSQYFDTSLYTGDQTSNVSVTDLAFQPDFVWGKNRSSNSNHWVFDAVRGTTRMLAPDIDPDEEIQSGITSFDSNGFTLGTWIGSSKTNDAYVAWSWLAGGSGSSNTDGSITSTVSANPTAGFSIATYSANNTAGATFGHGLGVAPSMVIIKKRNATERWVVYHQSISNQYIYLNETFAGETTNAALRFGNDSSVVAPSSTLVTIGTSNDVNGASGTYVAYCFAEVEGYSKFGSYTGNGSSDGVFIHLGFKPSFFLLKATSVDLESWSIFDSARDPDNFVNRRIMPNNANEEEEYPNTGSATMDFLSNGVKLRASNTAMNGSGVTFIYAAFAENPFGGFRTTPVTAR